MGSPSPSKMEGNNSFTRHIKFEHLYAGVSGGVVSTLVLHPLDLVKIRFQVNEGQGAAGRPAYQGIGHAMRSIVKTNGISGLYQGVTPNVWGAGMSWGLYFFLDFTDMFMLMSCSYNSMKTWMQDGDTRKNLGATTHMGLACTAGFGTLALTNPIWVTKTRLCLQYESEVASGQAVKHYRGMADALVQIYKTEGVRGLYKGFVPGMFGISHGALQFMAYEELKRLYNQYRQQPLDTRLGSGEYIIFAAISKMFAASLTYPYQVIRSRLQDQHRSYDGVIDVCRQTVRREGFWGLYKGLVPYTVHMTPNICIVFLFYELLSTSRGQESENREGWLAFYKGLGPCILRVTPACAITFVIYENVITLYQSHQGNGQS